MATAERQSAIQYYILLSHFEAVRMDIVSVIVVVAVLVCVGLILGYMCVCMESGCADRERRDAFRPIDEPQRYSRYSIKTDGVRLEMDLPEGRYSCSAEAGTRLLLRR
jgi:hypothetical protein